MNFLSDWREPVNLDFPYLSRGLFDDFVQNASCVTPFWQGKVEQ